MGICWSSSPPPQLGKFLFKWSIFASSFLSIGIVSHIHSDFQGDLKRLTASTLTMKTRIYEVRKGETFHHDLPKWASGSSILHNLPKSSENIDETLLGKQKNLIFSMPIYLSFPLLKTTTSREERSTCHTVAVPLHRSTISAKSHPNFLQNLAFESLFQRYFIYSPSYQEMLYCTNLNLAVKLKTIVLLCQLTSFQTDPKLVWIIGNLRLDKFVYHGGWGVLIDLWKMNFL